jgi:hypothetical protein
MEEDFCLGAHPKVCSERDDGSPGRKTAVTPKDDPWDVHMGALSLLAEISELE